MSDITCDLCGVGLLSRSDRFGDKEITLCEKCYKTEDVFEKAKLTGHSLNIESSTRYAKLK
ncbi:hypothetical protein [Colwellia ponticola]|uniref:Uncharacterized protein n=1 Tax=Colwellia ponticola TaxID=2304625 RepID=A0A8H2JJS2_9GAMM|nr:hypothetical protein [Colwellia ponticola]TMM41429.1 hypothetical protein FCS21_15580 [Colwellia ponticola]